MNRWFIAAIGMALCLLLNSYALRLLAGHRSAMSGPVIVVMVMCALVMVLDLILGITSHE